MRGLSVFTQDRNSVVLLTAITLRRKRQYQQQQIQQQHQHGGCRSIVLHLALVVKAHADFDFSSTRAWEMFYQQHYQDENENEWHSSISISMQTLVDLIPKNNDNSDDEEKKGVKKKKKKLLMIGCGTSQLPTWIQMQRSADIEMTLLDSSPTCIEQLKKRYGSNNNNNVKYICGDATRLSNSK
jgi:DNA-directed RNA polymerase subunit M/transcription elongation factor TFIIS